MSIEAPISSAVVPAFEHGMSLLSWFGELVSNLSPVLALFGAIYLFYKKESATRNAELKKDKREIYARFLSAAVDCWTQASLIGEDSDGRHPADMVERLDGIELELKLIAPDEVLEAAHTLISCLKNYTRDHAVQEFGEISEDQSGEAADALIESMVVAEENLAEKMRLDLGFAMPTARGKKA